MYTSKTITAEEALQRQFVNAILTEFEGDGEWPDLSKFATLQQLLKTDQRTLENCMGLMNAARDNDRLDAAIWRELKMCVDNNMDPDFLPKMAVYMQKTLRKGKKSAEPKL